MILPDDFGELRRPQAVGQRPGRVLLQPCSAKKIGHGGKSTVKECRRHPPTPSPAPHFGHSRRGAAMTSALADSLGASGYEAGPPGSSVAPKRLFPTGS